MGRLEHTGLKVAYIVKDFDEVGTFKSFILEFPLMRVGPRIRSKVSFDL